MIRIFCKTRSKNDDLLEKYNKETPTSVPFSLHSMGVDPIEPSELEEVLHKCENRKHSGVEKNWYRNDKISIQLY
jgi:hypothetical protein